MTHQITKTSLIDKNIPAIACSLTGGYLIEASAGTGKTWTLTGILLRLLVEKRYPPERIIATTFTRAAASEMQERLQLRLSQFYRYLQWLIGMHDVCPDWFDKTSLLDGNEILQQIMTQAKEAYINEYDDPINLYLLSFLLNNEDARALDLALRRLSLLLATLDKLFIGTLDSLAQKLLKEFSAELSYQTDTQISTDSEELTRSLIHDELRFAHQKVANENPKLYKILNKNIFGNVNEAYDAVNIVLQFYGAKIDVPKEITDANVQAFFLCLDEMTCMDISGFEPYYDVEFAKKQGMNGRAVITNNLKELPNIISTIKKHQENFLDKLPKDTKQLFNKLNDIDKDNLFKKGYDEQKAKFHQLPILSFKKLHTLTDELENIANDYQSWLYWQIAQKVKIKLKQQLENQNQSTFTFQMVRLTEALRNNVELTRHIRHLYPVALIDESQDISGLQSELIRLMYLDPMIQERSKDKKNYGFLLLVGDPKQAIYRFRGGDVANYNFIKHYGSDGEQKKPILNHGLSLTYNRRSHQALVDVLNQWFINNNKQDRENHANLGDRIFYQTITAINMEKSTSWKYKESGELPDYLTNHPLNILSVNDNKEDDKNKKHDKDKENYTLIARHINSLLQDGHIIDIGKETRNIKPSDIAVLARTYKDLMAIKRSLGELSISAITPQDVNVFSTKTAKEMYQLLLAVMHQTNKNMGSLLTSSFFNLSLSESQHIIKQGGDVYTALMIFLKSAKQKFHQYGIASMLNFCLLKNPLSEFHIEKQNKTLWENIAIQGERYMSDLWQLSELMSMQQSLKHIHETHFLTWFMDMIKRPDGSDKYKQLVLPSETGINLLTTHKSKGLEFPIVYVLGGDDKPKGFNKGFYPYSDEFGMRRLSPTSTKGDDKNYYKNKDIQEEVDELRRLMYVALTRASDQCFVIFNHSSLSKQKDQRPLLWWLEMTNNKNTDMPERLKDKIGHISLALCQDLRQEKYINRHEEPLAIEYYDWEDVFSRGSFMKATTTSATALMGQLSQQDDYGENESIKNLHSKNTITNIDYKNNDIRAYFKKGTDAGIFLHKILQMINPNDGADISKKIDGIIKTMGMFDNFSSDYQLNDEKDKNSQHHDLVEWISNIVHSPMTSGTNLLSLQDGSYARELSFTLGLNKSFNIRELNELFQQYGDKNIVIEDDKRDEYYKFLKGEIDLIYEHKGKFYVVDYKSNFVSDRLSDYHGDNLENVMSANGYWLQACVYQVALHRLLKLKIADYAGNEIKYLGKVEFVFLRGVDSLDDRLGHISWEIPMALVLKLDTLFGN